MILLMMVLALGAGVGLGALAASGRGRLQSAPDRREAAMLRRIADEAEDGLRRAADPHGAGQLEAMAALDRVRALRNDDGGNDR